MIHDVECRQQDCLEAVSEAISRYQIKKSQDALAVAVDELNRLRLAYGDWRVEELITATCLEHARKVIRPTGGRIKPAMPFFKTALLLSKNQDKPRSAFFRAGIELFVPRNWVIEQRETAS